MAFRSALPDLAGRTHTRPRDRGLPVLLVQDGRTWTVDQWVADGVWDPIDYHVE
jgi:hypothetical protein